MAGFIFVSVVLVAALLAGFRSKSPGQLPGIGLMAAFVLATGAYLFV